MNTNELNTTNLKSADDYIALAHQLRAQALRGGINAIGRSLTTVMHAVSARFHRSARA